MPGPHQLRQRQDGPRLIAVEIPVERGQSIPGHRGAMVMGIVIAEIQGEEIEPGMPAGNQVRVGVGLFVLAVAARHRYGLIGCDEKLLEGMVKGIEEIQHVQQQCRRRRHTAAALSRPQAEQRQQPQRTMSIAAARGRCRRCEANEKRPPDDLPMHQHFGRGEVGPFEVLQRAAQRRAGAASGP